MRTPATTMATKPNTSPEKKAPARRAARMAAILALYQMESTGIGVERVISEFKEHRFSEKIDGVDLTKTDRAFFESIVAGVVEVQDRLDGYLRNHLASGWRLSRLSATVRATLRAGLFEMVRRPEVPFKVVIDEYLDIAASFDENDTAFVNAVLDGAARDARADERI